MTKPDKFAARVRHQRVPRQLIFVGLLILILVAMFANLLGNLLIASPHAEHKQTNVDASQLSVIKLDQVSSLQLILEQEQDARVMLVGESHTRLDHHQVQLETLKYLYQQSPNIALGVEWFQKPFQKYLDEFIAGNLSEQEMLHATEYFSRWRYDYRLYRPIMQFARDNKIPVIALNASRELTQALSRQGFDDLPEDLKDQLPGSYDWSDKDYEKRLYEMFKLHPEYGKQFDSFLRGQLTWDESMAETAADYLRDKPDYRMLVLAGSGHIQYGSGIPNRIQRRMQIKPVSILVSEQATPITRDMADYLVMSAPRMLEPVGMIGAFLKLDSDLVIIDGFSENSAIKDANVEKGAVIVGIDDTKVRTLADFKLAMLTKKAGDTIELHYLEQENARENEAKTVQIKLR